MDKHGVPPTKRLFRVAMLDPSQGFIDPWGKFGDLETYPSSISVIKEFSLAMITKFFKFIELKLSGDHHKTGGERRRFQNLQTTRASFGGELRSLQPFLTNSDCQENYSVPLVKTGRAPHKSTMAHKCQRFHKLGLEFCGISSSCEVFLIDVGSSHCVLDKLVGIFIDGGPEEENGTSKIFLAVRFSP
ncbi:hypothetical protein Tco_0851917 [Tanacetum coccineum]